ncbi:MAG: hypothetical protein ACTSPM_10610 [Candidatus Heimdallarchaeota archaeon]
MDARHQHKSLFSLIALLFGALLFGISFPAALIQYIVIPGFFKNGTFSPDLIYTWSVGQIIGIIVFTLGFIAFEIFAIITTINVIKEFVRRGREKSSPPIETSFDQYQGEY